jgi:hypothetical protein
MEILSLIIFAVAACGSAFPTSFYGGVRDTFVPFVLARVSVSLSVKDRVSRLSILLKCRARRIKV